MALPGSALVSFAIYFPFYSFLSSQAGDTGALASLSGPIEVRLAAEIPSKATFEVIMRPLSNVPGTESKSLATTIRSSLEPSLILTKNPRTLVQLVIQGLSSPSNIYSKDSLSAAMINASTLAFLKASSVPMKGVVTAVSVGQLRSGALILDPNDEEAESLHMGGVFAFLFADAVVDCVWTSWKSTSGSYNEKEMFEAMGLGKIGARAVYDAMRENFQTVQQVREGPTFSQPEMTKMLEDDDDKMEI